ncbi:hypothetical protein EI94DRAFT_1739154 [Lactarius quietus]|nr:hypothetical protein EI94DRAFT_1739154 [Lactarius quietus]
MSVLLGALVLLLSTQAQEANCVINSAKHDGHTCGKRGLHQRASVNLTCPSHFTDLCYATFLITPHGRRLERVSESCSPLIVTSHHRILGTRVPGPCRATPHVVMWLVLGS